MNSNLYLGLLALLAACAAPVYEGKFAFDEGWRVGTVTEVGAAGSIDEASTKGCREELPPSSTDVRARHVPVRAQLSRRDRPRRE